MTQIKNNINTYADLTAYNADTNKDYPNVSYIEGTDEVKWAEDPYYTCKVVYLDGHTKYITTDTVEQSQVYSTDSTSSEYRENVKKLYINCTTMNFSCDQMRYVEWIEFKSATPPTFSTYNWNGVQGFYCPIYVPSESLETYRTAFLNVSASAQVICAILSKQNQVEIGHISFNTTVNVAANQFFINKGNRITEVRKNGSIISETGTDMISGTIDVYYKEKRMSPIMMFNTRSVTGKITDVYLDNGTTNLQQMLLNGYVDNFTNIPNSIEYMSTIDWYYNKAAADTPTFNVPTSVEYIGPYCFNEYKGDIICNIATPPILGGGNSFKSSTDYKIYVPAASVSAYQAATYWSTYAAKIFAIS